VFLPDGTFAPLPKLATEPFLELWEQQVFRLLLAEGKITEEIVANLRSWPHFPAQGPGRILALGGCRGCPRRESLLPTRVEGVFLVPPPQEGYGRVQP
jgi:hypothetical protein